MTVEIRKACAEDAEGVTDVLTHTDFLKPEYQTGEKLPDIRNFCVQGAFWLAKQNGKVLSVIMVTRTDVPQGRIYFNIPILVTRTEFRQGGLARLLLRKVLDEATTLGVTTVEAYAQNEKSVNLLKNQGFVAVDGCLDAHGNQKYEFRGLQGLR